MARFRVHTESGAMYIIDEEAMTWSRRAPASGDPIIGIVSDNGRLSDPHVNVRLGARMIIPIVTHQDGITFNTYIKTTPVLLAEVIS